MTDKTCVDCRAKEGLFETKNQACVFVVVEIFPRLNCFESVRFLFSFVSDYGNEFDTKENKNYTGSNFLNQKQI